MNTKKLKRLSACSNAVEWLATQKNATEAWNNCERGDWMMWLLGKLSGPVGSESRKKLVLAACGCARLSLKYVKAGEDRPRIAIETAESYALGKGKTLQDVKAARNDAAYAAYAAYAADAADYDAAYDAAHASASASAYAYASAYAAYAANANAAASAYAAAYDAAYAADAADYDAAHDAAYAAASAYASAAYAADANAAAARSKMLKACADVVREHYPKPPKL